MPKSDTKQQASLLKPFSRSAQQHTRQSLFTDRSKNTCKPQPVCRNTLCLLRDKHLRTYRFEICNLCIQFWSTRPKSQHTLKLLPATLQFETGAKMASNGKNHDGKPIGFSRGIYTTLLAHQIPLQSEIFALPCFRYLHRHYPREIGKNGRAFYLLLACSNPCFFSFTSTFKNSLSQW